MADRRKYVQGQNFYLFGSGITSIDTQIKLRSFKLPNSNTPITMDMFGEIGYATLDPEIPSIEENISFTDVIQNSDGTAVLTGVTRGLKLDYPYGVDTSLRKPHIGGQILRITDNVQHFDQLANKFNDETIEGLYTFPGSTSEGRPRNAYVSPAMLSNELITKQEAINILTNPTIQPTVVSTTTATTGNVTAGSLAWLHPSSGSDRYLDVTISMRSDETISSITFNGVALTQKTSHVRNTGKLRVEKWGLINPSLGTHSIVVTFSAPTYASTVANSIESVDQTTPINALMTPGTDGNSTSPTGSTLVTNSNCLILDGISTAFDPIVFTAGTDQAILGSVASNAVYQVAVSAESVLSPASVVTDYLLNTSTNWSLVAIAFNGVSTPGGTSQSPIQFQDEGSNLGTSGTVDTVDFTGAGVTATRTGNKVTVNVTGGGGGADEQVKVSATDTTTEYLDNKIELVSGTNTTVTKTILNPGANEKIRYQVNSTGGSSGSVSTRTSFSVFQDFNTDIVINGGPSFTTYGGLYPWGTSSSGIAGSTENNHPGIIDITSPGGGPANIGVGLLGIDMDNLEIEIMFSMKISVSIALMEMPISTGSLTIFCNNNTSNIIINGTTIPVTYTTAGWDTLKIVYNATGTLLSAYLNGTLLSSTIPPFIATSSPGFTGSQCKYDYISINGTITR